MGWQDAFRDPFGTIGDAAGAVGGAFKSGAGWVSDQFDRGKKYGEIDPDGFLTGASGAAGKFADQSQRGFQAAGDRARATEDMWRRRAMGEDSLSAEQLRQGLQQNLAAQQSMAASARPGNAAMMARQASVNAANLGAGLSGQQATAGIAERQAALQGLAQHQQAMRGQDLQAVLGSRGQQIQGYGTLENARAGRFGASMNQPTFGERIVGGAMGLGSLLLSDERSKEGIEDAAEDVESFMSALKPKSYEYRDGVGQSKGRHMGILAQDVERSEMGKGIVREVKSGPAKGYKALDANRLQSALLASTANLNDRLRKLEGK